MQVRVFTIPIFENAELTEEMNGFLRSQKVLTIDKQQIVIGEQAFWTFCVTYLPATAGNGSVLPRQGKVDYKEVLDEETFAIFSQLRSIRKQLAEQDAVPAYAVFTDSELAEMAKLEKITEKSILTIQGIGKKKVEKYGAAMCAKYNEIVSKDERLSDVLPLV